MEEKITAVYLMVRASELAPEDHGNFDRPLAQQKQACLGFLKSKGIPADASIAFYTCRGDMLTDIERDSIARVVVYDLDRLGAHKEDVEGILFELGARQIEVLAVRGNES